MQLFTTEFLPDRRLKIIATDEFRAMIRAELAEDKTNQNALNERRLEDDILSCLRDSGDFDYAFASEVGALTDAPMICNDREDLREVWAFMDYAVTSIPAELAEEGYAILEHSEVEPQGDNA